MYYKLYTIFTDMEYINCIKLKSPREKGSFKHLQYLVLHLLFINLYYICV